MGSYKKIKSLRWYSLYGDGILNRVGLLGVGNIKLILKQNNRFVFTELTLLRTNLEIREEEV